LKRNNDQFLQDFLKKTFINYRSKFADEEKKLKEEEQKLLGKKTVISKEDYKKESDALRKKVLKYQNDRRTALDDIAKKRASAREQLLNKIDPILDTYNGW
jgi:transposase